ncbi:cytochrome P450 [Cercophora newfieldiana]|uniref:Cytochrome P450 n=1 Tax=Cercophora newfieldiana TaxID=92897 RepID=A0AA39YSH2_9PEZI|nr:cytochrome P450 [Cercophora newfieldiana]
MDAINGIVNAFRGNPFYFSAIFLLPLLLPVLASRVVSNRRANVREPWKLPNWKGIPLIGNTIEYLVNNSSFITRTALAMQTRDIVQFYLGPIRAYLVSGPQNVQALFRKSASVSADKFSLMTMDALMCYSKEDIAKFASDKTGRLAEAKEGAVAPDGTRYWFGMHHHMKTLSQITSTSVLTDKFLEFFDERVQVYPLGEPVTVNLYNFMRTQMAGAAIRALVGDALFARVGEENLLDAFWAYDSVVINLMYALPKWIDPKPWKIRARAYGMCLEWLKQDFDAVGSPESEENDVDWHPVMGLRFLREYLVWYKKVGLSDDARAGNFLGFLLGLNANTIPIAGWALMEIVQDRQLWRAVQEEAESAFEVNPGTGKRKLNIHKMMGLPILQSVYAETLRVHVSVNVTREVVGESASIAGYQLPRNSLIQAPTRIAHFNEKAWATADHSASEFWPYRHVKYANIQDENGEKTEKPEFVLAAGPNDFFPYGGGVSICPGRHFAKQEIMATIAVMVTTFEIEMVEWMSFDGKTKSDRPAQENAKYSGSASMPPDRDMKVRWIRRV